MKPGARFVVYARTSRDEAEGQDIGAQARQVREDGVEAGGVAVATYTDEGVSGATAPLERDGFLAAANLVRLGRADVVLVRDWSRLDRRNPFRAGDTYLFLYESGVVVEATRAPPLPQKPADDWDLPECIMAAIAFAGPYAYRHEVRKNTQHAMDDLAAGRRVTASGKPVGRPQKYTDAEVRAAYTVAVKEGSVAAARWLSAERGIHDALTEETRRKRRASHSALIERFRAIGLPWPVGNATLSETVSDKAGTGRVDEGPVSDGSRKGVGLGPTA